MVKVNHATTPVQKSPLTGVDGTIWRHTIGRVSNLVRVPINLLASLYIGGKIIGKVLAIPVTYSIVGIHSLVTKEKSKYQGRMSFRGIGISGVEFALSIRGASSCFARTIMAPGKNEQAKNDFVQGMKKTWTLVSGGVQESNRSVSEIYKRLILKKPNTNLKS